MKERGWLLEGGEGVMIEIEKHGSSFQNQTLGSYRHFILTQIRVRLTLVNKDIMTSLGVTVIHKYLADLLYAVSESQSVRQSTR